MIERARLKLIFSCREICFDRKAKGPRCFGSLRYFLCLGVIPERGTGEKTTSTFTSLSRSEPLDRTNRDAPRATVGTILGDVGAPELVDAASQSQPETFKLGIPSEVLVPPRFQRDAGNGLLV